MKDPSETSSSNCYPTIITALSTLPQPSVQKNKPEGL